jgi:FSR family fosmidomycin resistance protein-like MFS transporter
LQRRRTENAVAPDTSEQVAEPPPLPAPERSAVTVAEAAVDPLPFAEPAGVEFPLAAIGLLAATHFVVDISASTINPLWQGFEEKFGLAHGQLLGVTAAWTVSNSIAQVLFAWWADRMTQRWLLWAGAIVGVACLSCAGFAPGPWSLALLLVTGGLGIAAFHPEAAAASGAVLPEKRSRMMAIFALSGYIGQSIGPYYSARITNRFGLPSLIWGGLLLLAALALLTSRQRYVPSPAGARRNRAAHERAPPQRDRWGLLLLTGTLRIAPVIGVPLVIAYWLTDRELIGTAQSAFMFGVGAGSMLCAIGVRREWEPTVLWLLPLLAAPCIAVIPLTTGAGLIADVGLCGLLLGVSMPVFISFGQQLLPDYPRAASSITMGVSWGTAGAVVAKVIHELTKRGELTRAFWLLAAVSAAAALLGSRLPSLTRKRPPASGGRQPAESA